MSFPILVSRADDRHIIIDVQSEITQGDIGCWCEVCGVYVDIRVAQDAMEECSTRLNLHYYVNAENFEFSELVL